MKRTGTDSKTPSSKRDNSSMELEVAAPKVWRKGVDPLHPEEVLEYDSSAYLMLHSLQTEWPCLSFDVVRDKLGAHRTQFPHTMYIAAGTQATTMKDNKIMLMKLDNLCKTNDDDNEELDDDADGDELEARVELRAFSHFGCVNRVRSAPQQPHIIANWSSSGQVHIWDALKHLQALDNNEPLQAIDPLQSFAHTTEGYGLDWSNVTTGSLLSGSIAGKIHHWVFAESSWRVDREAYQGHNGSVEDIQWSPTEANVFATCGVDKTIKIWDIRSKAPAIGVTAHDDDVNVISWNPSVAYLLVSGSDDSSFKIWDLRSFKTGGGGANTATATPAAHFKWHQAAITSVEWHPSEESVLAVSGEDGQLSLWDLSLERDDNDMTPEELRDVPPQLLFVHMGQKDIKEIHWHPQVPGSILSTASDGFNVFKTINS